ncbi:MAG TPA: hypothetical protein VIO61_05590 [Anaerolineaceae bacterium]
MNTNDQMQSPSFYGPVDESQRTVLLENYLASLNIRNGVLDPESGTLPNREESLSQMNAAPIHSVNSVKQDLFDRLYEQFNPRSPDLTPEMLLLLTFCKMNAGEAYGVRVVKTVHSRQDRGKTNLRTRVIQVAQEEEEYHTRILVGAAHYYNINVTGIYRPKPALRFLIYSIAYAPRPLFHPILFASEVVGVYLFNWTLNQIGNYIKSQPELQQAMEQRLIEILIDEVGHVAFNRLVMGASGRQLGHTLTYPTLRGMPTITPELAALGFNGQVMRAFGNFDYRHLPEEVRRRGYFA